jgi:hypothetical protein
METSHMDTKKNHLDEKKRTGERGGNEIEVGVEVLVDLETETAMRETDRGRLEEMILEKRRGESVVMGSLGGNRDLDARILKTTKIGHDTDGNIESVNEIQMMKVDEDTIIETTVVSAILTRKETGITDVPMIQRKDNVKTRLENLVIPRLNATYLLAMALTAVIAVTTIPTCHPKMIPSTNLYLTNIARLLTQTQTPQ